MRFYYGWINVAITAVIFALVIGASIQSFGLFVLPVSKELGLSRAQMNTGAILLNLGMAIAAPFIGRLIDRFPAKPIMAVSAVVFGASLVALGLGSGPVFGAAVIALPLAAAIVGCGTLTCPALVSRWFNVQRGRALAFSTIGISVGPVLVTPLVGLMINAMGWRQSLVALGLGSGALIAILAMLVRNVPRPGDIEPGASDRRTEHAPDEAVDTLELTIGQLLRMPRFWAIALGCALVFAVLTADIVSLIPLAQSKGFSTGEAASLMSAYGICAVAGALLFAWIGDRFNEAVTFAAMALLIGLANGALLVAHGYASYIACAGLIGLTGGITSPGFMAVLAAYFGVRSFGLVIGIASFLSTFVSALAVRFAGEIFDRTGGYDLMLLSFLAIGVLAASCLIGAYLSGERSQRRADLAK